MDYVVLAIVCVALGVILGVRLAYWLILWDSGVQYLQELPVNTQEPTSMERK